MNPRYIERLSWRMGEVYGAVVDQILINLARHFKYISAGQEPSGAWAYQVQKLAEMGQVNRETERIILSMLGNADEALRTVLEEAILDGLKDAEPALKQAAFQGLLPGGVKTQPVLDPAQMQAFRTYYKQSADSLNLVNTVMLESTQAAYQATVADIASRMSQTQGILNVATGKVVSGVESWNTAVHDAVQKMVKNGITGFIDHGGHKWSPEAYVTMDVRTTMSNTARAAVFERMDDYGSDLYQVSWHDGARPLCFPWQGKVISRTDTARDIEDGEGNTVHVYAQSETTYGQAAGLFGVNCGHYAIPFFPGFSRIRQPRQDAEENAKAYQESQQQRYLERRLREEKRDLEVLKAQGAPEEQIKAQRAKVKKCRDNLNEFCDETGRARSSSRERTPINATFPKGYDPKTFPTQQRDKMQRFFGKSKQDTVPKVATEGPMRGVPRLKQLSPEEAATGVNPLFSKSSLYQHNCANCVVAEELRIRGYDVTADLKDSKTNISSFWFDSQYGRGSWTDSFVGVKYKNIGATRKANQTKKISEIMNGWGENSRAVVFVEWDGHSIGHYFTAVNTKYGVKYINPQHPEADASEFFNRTKPSQTALFRLDDKEIAEYVRKVVRWTEKKP